MGAALAPAGYPTLDTAYSGAPGLPQALSNIPLEYFATALRWFGQQPERIRGPVFLVCGGR